jgi:hypothetical protein
MLSTGLVATNMQRADGMIMMSHHKSLWMSQVTTRSSSG